MPVPLRKLARGGIGLVMVTHRLPDIIPEMRRVVMIRAGRVHGDWPKSRVLNESALGSLFGVPVEALERVGYLRAVMAATPRSNYGKLGLS